MNSLVYGSLGDIAGRSGKSVAETFLSVDALVLVDTSHSMDIDDCPGGRRRYEVACEQLIRLQREIPGKVGVISWSSSAYFCPGGLPKAPFGSTNLAGALDFVKPADGCGIRMIVISDGEPDNQKAALDLAAKFQTKIDTIYCGPEMGSGKEFLIRLSLLTGGQAVDNSVSDLGNLSKTVKALLAA